MAPPDAEQPEEPQGEYIPSFGANDEYIGRSKWEDDVLQGRNLPTNLEPGSGEWTGATPDAHAADGTDIMPNGPPILYVHGPVQMEPLEMGFATAEPWVPAFFTVDAEGGGWDAALSPEATDGYGRAGGTQPEPAGGAYPWHGQDRDPAWGRRNGRPEPDDGQEKIPDEEKTTIMLRNIPNNYTRDHIEELLNEQGMSGAYDLVYLPYDFSRRAGYGYAFVNFRTNEQAGRASAAIRGFDRWGMASGKTAAVDWAHHQGKEGNIERFRNSSVMHPRVPDAYKPMCYDEQGNRDTAPLEPGRELRRPRFRHRG